MKTIKKTALAVIASMFLFTSCEKEEKTTPSGESIQDANTYEFAITGNPYRSYGLWVWMKEFDEDRTFAEWYSKGLMPFFTGSGNYGWKKTQTTKEDVEYIDFKSVVYFEYEYRDRDSMTISLKKNGILLEKLTVGSGDTARIEGVC